MIGIGNWGCHVDTMFFKGDVKFTITDNGGEYGFELHMDGPIPEFQIKEIKEENDAYYSQVMSSVDLTAIANVEMLPGKDIDVALTFAGDTFNGVIKVPFLGKIKLNNGYRLAE